MRVGSDRREELGRRKWAFKKQWNKTESRKRGERRSLTWISKGQLQSQKSSRVVIEKTQQIALTLIGKTFMSGYFF
jgi:hypothetical protein